MSTIITLLEQGASAVGSACIAVLMSVASLFGYAHTVDPGIITVSPSGITSAVATSSRPVVATTTVTKAPTKPKPPLVTRPKPPVVVPIVVPPVPSSPPAASTTTEIRTIGATTLAVQSVPLLSGGVVHAGGSVPISYLQITNVGTAGAMLKGFWIKQNGSASLNAISGFSTVDDQGGSRDATMGAQGSALFPSGLALAPIDIYLAPGQMRLFTIKVVVSQTVSQYIGTELKLDVASIETTGQTLGTFPIQGTTWVIAQ